MALVYISLGTNIEKEKNTFLGLDALQSHFGELILSSLFESEAVGFNGDPFYNMVVGFNTEQSVAQVVSTLKTIEKENGRTINAEKFSARTLDLDILLYDDQVLEQPANIPRAEICYNAFVLWPLSEIAGEFIHPTRKLSIEDIWQAFDKSSQVLKIVPLKWQANPHL